MHGITLFQATVPILHKKTRVHSCVLHIALAYSWAEVRQLFHIEPDCHYFLPRCICCAIEMQITAMELLPHSIRIAKI